MRAPSAGVPLPAGRPVPSGRTLISQAAISAALMGLPSFGDCENAALEPRASASTTANPRSLRVHMLHLPAALDRPAGDGVVVLACEGGYGRNSGSLATRGHNLGSGGLSVPCLVPRPALQYRRATVPAPWHTATSERLAMHRLLQGCLRPALAAVGGHDDLWH